MAGRYAAFVRNVMIGREGLHRLVLLELFEQAGATAARSYISTGNVTFTAAQAQVPAIIARAEEAIAGVIGRHEEVFVRSIDALKALVASDPFAHSPFPDAVDRVVSFTKRPIDGARLDLPHLSRRGDVAIFEAREREVFVVSRLVDGRTSSGGGWVEKLVNQRVTTRSWNTVTRITSSPAALDSPDLGRQSD